MSLSIRPQTPSTSLPDERIPLLSQPPSPRATSSGASPGIPASRTSPGGGAAPRQNVLALHQPPSPRHEVVIDIGEVGLASPHPAGAPPGQAIHPSDQAAIRTHVAGHLARNVLDAIKRIGSAGSFEGKVSVKEGRFVSDQPQINALLGYAKLNPGDFVLTGKESLTLKLDPAIAELHKTLKDALTVKKVMVRPGEGTPLPADNTEDLGSNLLIVHLQELLQNGRAASNVKVASGDGASLRIADVFAGRSPSISSSNEALAGALRQKVDGDTDLKIKLAAASMLQVATTKHTSLKGLAVSLFVSALIGTLWELKAYPYLATKMKAGLAALNLSSRVREALTTTGDLLLRAVPNATIEPVDTASVLFSGEEMQGGEDASLMAKLPEGLHAGMISAFLGVPANLVDIYKATSDLVKGALAVGTNQLAVFGAASGVPPGIKRDMEHTHAAVVSHLAGGQLALPEGKAEGKDLIAHGRELAQRALAVDPGTAILTQSMAVSSIAGAVPAILSSDVLNLLDESPLRIMRSVLFQPIEAISMNSLALLSKVGIPGLMKSDPSKIAALTELVLKKADAGPQGGEAQIKAAEFDAIFKPEILGRMGQHITDGINSSLAAPRNLVAKTGLATPSPEPLVNRLDLDAIRREHTSMV
jgi:hypothetical protein